MDGLVLAGMILFLIVLIMGKEYINSRSFHRHNLQRIFESYGMPSERVYKTGELEHIQKYYLRHPGKNQLDDITWNDLNMDSLYQQINVSCSAAGDEYLYYRLRTPLDSREDLEQWESRISFFMEHEEERRQVQGLFYQLGRMGRYSLHEYIENLDILGERKNGKYILYNVTLFFVYREHVCVAAVGNRRAAFGGVPQLDRLFQGVQADRALYHQLPLY